MTAQQRWDSLPPTQKEEVCNFIMEKLDTAQAEQPAIEPPKPRAVYTGRPRMFPVHEKDKQYG